MASPAKGTDCVVLRNTIDEPDTKIETWKPAKLVAARLLAIGCTQQYTADRTNTPLRTVQSWCADRTFYEYMQHLRQVAWQRVEPSIMANVELAIEMQRQVFAGEMSPDEPRYREARQLLDRMLDRLLYVEPATTEGGASASGVSVPITLNLGTPN